MITADQSSFLAAHFVNKILCGGRHMRVVSVGTLAIAAICLVVQVSSIAQTGALKNAIGMEFMKIPAGEFMMGCSPDDNSCPRCHSRCAACCRDGTPFVRCRV